MDLIGSHFVNGKKPSAIMETHDLVQCDTCGRWFTFYELAETIEERLCEYCASGLNEEMDWEYDEDPEYWDGDV